MVTNNGWHEAQLTLNRSMWHFRINGRSVVLFTSLGDELQFYKSCIGVHGRPGTRSKFPPEITTIEEAKRYLEVIAKMEYQ